MTIAEIELTKQDDFGGYSLIPIRVPKKKVEKFLEYVPEARVAAPEDCKITHYYVPKDFVGPGGTYAIGDKPLDKDACAAWEKERASLYSLQHLDKMRHDNPSIEFVVIPSTQVKIIVEITKFVSDLPEIKWSFVREIKLGIDSMDVNSAIPRFLNRIEELAKEFEEVRGFMNNKLGVHISGNQMLLYNRVLLMSDACTDDLQKHLNDGWRIIVVCPQEARRPDYILGRFDQDWSK